MMNGTRDVWPTPEVEARLQEHVKRMDGYTFTRLKLELRDPFGQAIYTAVFNDLPVGIGVLLQASNPESPTVRGELPVGDLRAPFYVVVSVVEGPE